MIFRVPVAANFLTAAVVKTFDNLILLGWGTPRVHVQGCYGVI